MLNVIVGEDRANRILKIYIEKIKMDRINFKGYSDSLIDRVYIQIYTNIFLRHNVDLYGQKKK